jgi:hypothetical protein
MNTKEITRIEAERIVNDGGEVVVILNEQGHNLVADKELLFTSKKITNKARYFLF